ncbi:MAG: pyridoxamine 5'-phosphate oxidase family protein [Chloroflexi bacterium]|nr:pyridoxamine 5'-phosphate oxidase family protein [Chloroflexota bacterium]
MAKMTQRIKELFDKTPTVVLSTATVDGIPNAVPVGAKKILDAETILISNQYLNKTLANMKANPKVGLTFWQEREGYQLKGTATVETTGRRFEETVQWIEELSAKVGRPLKSKGAVILQIEEIYSITSGPGAGKRLV